MGRVIPAGTGFISEEHDEDMFEVAGVPTSGQLHQAGSRVSTLLTPEPRNSWQS